MIANILLQLVTKEEWKPIEGYDGYEVSSFGQIRSWRTLHWMGKRGSIPAKRKTPKLIKPSPMSTDRMAVTLCVNNKKKTKRVYELVAKAFLANPSNLPEINHMDGDHRNDAVSNLEWCTKSHNVAHAIEYGLYAQGERKSIKLTTDKVLMIRQLCQIGIRRKDIATFYGIHRGTVNGIHWRTAWASLP